MQHHEGENGKINLTVHILAASFVGLLAAAAAATSSYRWKKSSMALRAPNNIFPRIETTESGRVGNIERFSHYVARLLGILDANECPQLCKLAYEYLRKTKGCEDKIYEYFASEADPDSLYINLIDEFDRCILSYFAFHWSQATIMISQVLNVETEENEAQRHGIGSYQDSRGKEVDLSIYKGKVVLIVNIASKCGFTDMNYTQLTKLYSKYKEKG